LELVSAQIDKQVCWPYLNKSSKSTAAIGVATGKASYCDVVSALVSAQWSGLTAQDLNTAKVMPGKKSRRATLSAAHLPSRQCPAAQPGQKKAEKIVKPLGAAAVSRLQLGGHLPGIWLVAATGTVQADLTGNAQGFVIATHRLWPSF